MYCVEGLHGICSKLTTYRNGKSRLKRRNNTGDCSKAYISDL